MQLAKRDPVLQGGRPDAGEPRDLGGLEPMPRECEPDPISSTLLGNAGVSENLAADIVGHEKPRITYGLYSGGAGMAQKAKAVELVRYLGMP